MSSTVARALLSANYRGARLVPDGPVPHLHLELENTSGSPWLPEHQVALSYQVFDSDTGVVLTEGSRYPLSGLAPGATISFDIPLDLPSEPGAYRLYVSPMIEGETWAYQENLPFLLGQLVVRPGMPLETSRLAVTDFPTLHRWSFFRRLGRAVTLPFLTVWRNRRLSYTLTKREILSRSRGSVGGSLWTILTPLLLMATYFFVFGLVLKSRFENDPSPASFALYFLAGMLPWLAFSEAAGRAPAC